MRRRLSVCWALLLLGAQALDAAPGEAWEGLRALQRVAVDVTLAMAPPGLTAAELGHRVETALRRRQPAPRLDPTSADRLHLAASVRPYGASELRGFYLPFSGTYGIGPVRLTVERPATIAGIPAPVRVTAWQAERQARGPWPRSAAEIVSLVDELLTTFFDGYRRAGAP